MADLASLDTTVEKYLKNIHVDLDAIDSLAQAQMIKLHCKDGHSVWYHVARLPYACNMSDSSQKYPSMWKEYHVM